MSIVAFVILQLNGFIDVIEFLLHVAGQAFVEFMLEALEKPWLVRR